MSACLSLKGREQTGRPECHMCCSAQAGQQGSAGRSCHRGGPCPLPLPSCSDEAAWTPLTASIPGLPQGPLTTAPKPLCGHPRGAQNPPRASRREGHSWSLLKDSTLPPPARESLHFWGKNQGAAGRGRSPALCLSQEKVVDWSAPTKLGQLPCTPACPHAGRPPCTGPGGREPKALVSQRGRRGGAPASGLGGQLTLQAPG